MSCSSVDEAYLEEIKDIPYTISYSEEDQPSVQKTAFCWALVQACMLPIGRFLRNTFFLPLFNKKIDEERALNQKLANKISEALQNTNIFYSEKISELSQFFSVRDINVEVKGAVTKIFTIRLFESKVPLNGKKLRVILFCFNGNKECRDGSDLNKYAWDPLNIQELGKASITVLQALEATGLRVDSLVSNSLGNLALGSLPDDSKAVPPTLIINRGLTSVKKVINSLAPFPLNYILYGVAKLCEWNADPEKRLLDFFEREKQENCLARRKVVIIEARRDFFFSGAGAFDPEFHKKIEDLGVEVFRAQFWPYPYHSRAHHALCLNKLKNNSETVVLTPDEEFFTIFPEEKMSNAIARNIFLEGTEEWHTCYCIGGADASLEIGTVREVVPLLSAFKEEGEKTESSSR